LNFFMEIRDYYYNRDLSNIFKIFEFLQKKNIIHRGKITIILYSLNLKELHYN